VAAATGPGAPAALPATVVTGAGVWAGIGPGVGAPSDSEPTVPVVAGMSVPLTSSPLPSVPGAPGVPVSPLVSTPPGPEVPVSRPPPRPDPSLRCDPPCRSEPRLRRPDEGLGRPDEGLGRLDAACGAALLPDAADAPDVVDAAALVV